MSTDTEIVIDEKITKEIKEPSRYNVILLNDDATPMEWVIDVLETVFRHSRENAETLTLKIHNENSAIVGTFSYEIAEQKTMETVNLSRNQGFPLQVKLEEE
jgi:ATP-dependent Clp protease adaptor protein ClpS